MTTTQLQNKLLESDSLVIEETIKLRYLFGLKNVIRSHLSRQDSDVSESVAEHVYGMHILVEYFSKLEALDQTLDMRKVAQLIQFHDVSEIETGDISTNHKTDADRAREKASFTEVLKKVPDLLLQNISELNDEYEAQETPEAKFVKAIDKFEPMIQFYDESHRQIFSDLQFTEEDLHRTKRKYIAQYPYILRFYTVIANEFSTGEYFYKSA